MKKYFKIIIAVPLAILLLGAIGAIGEYFDGISGIGAKTLNGIITFVVGLALVLIGSRYSNRD